MSTGRKILIGLIAFWLVVSAPALAIALVDLAIHLLGQLGHSANQIGTHILHPTPSP